MSSSKKARTEKVAARVKLEATPVPNASENAVTTKIASKLLRGKSSLFM